MKLGGELHDPAALLSGMRVWIYSIGGCVGPRGVWIFWRRKKYPADGNRKFRSSSCRLVHLLQHPTVPTVGSEGVAVAQSI